MVHNNGQGVEFRWNRSITTDILLKIKFSRYVLAFISHAKSVAVAVIGDRLFAAPEMTAIRSIVLACRPSQITPASVWLINNSAVWSGFDRELIVTSAAT